MKTAVLKYVCILAILFESASNVWGFADEVDKTTKQGADGAGNCGKLKPEILGEKLAPCAEAAKDKDVKVSHKCCDVVKKVHTSCLYALLLSKESKSLGIKPEVAVTIPKRCKIKAISILKITSAEDIRCQHGKSVSDGAASYET